MTWYRLHHMHTAAECSAVFASWRGFASPLRHGVATGTCRSGGHELWWDIDVETPAEALGMLPDFVASRTRVSSIDEIPIP